MVHFGTLAMYFGDYIRGRLNRTGWYSWSKIDIFYMQSCCYRNKVNVTITSLYQIHLLIHILDFAIHFQEVMRRWWTSWYDDGQLMYRICCWKLWHLILCMLLYQIFHWIKTVIFAKDSVMVTTKRWWSSLLYTVIFTKYNNVVMFTTGFPGRTVARVSLLISSDVRHIVFTVSACIKI